MRRRPVRARRLRSGRDIAASCGSASLEDRRFRQAVAMRPWRAFGRRRLGRSRQPRPGLGARAALETREAPDRAVLQPAGVPAPAMVRDRRDVGVCAGFFFGFRRENGKPVSSLFPAAFRLAFFPRFQPDVRHQGFDQGTAAAAPRFTSGARGWTVFPMTRFLPQSLTRRRGVWSRITELRIVKPASLAAPIAVPVVDRAAGATGPA